MLGIVGEWPSDDEARPMLDERPAAYVDDECNQDEYLGAAIVERPFTTLGPATVRELRKDEDEWESDNEQWSWERW